ncbi:MAG: hypothetical protein E6J01_13905 [Chloroflexi bacterium]|nr:MAG: hypothetical protein E6J01_13905 [Chloroflexota bacterium]
MKKLVVAVGLALAVLGLPGAQAAVAGPAYLAVTSFSATLQNPNLAKLSVTTGGNIPIRADDFINSNLVVGLAWADLSTGKVFVATIHPVLGRDSLQNPVGWHAHTATLAGVATAPHDFCVASIDSTPTAGIKIEANTMAVNVAASDLPEPPDRFNAAKGFTIQKDSACVSGLAVQLSS